VLTTEQDRQLAAACRFSSFFFVQIRKMFELKGRALLSSKKFLKKKDFEV
jgi:hypothetical protein